MIFFKRRRLLFWLIKAYFKKKGKTLLLFFLLGCLIFVLLNLLFHYIISKEFFVRQDRIGIAGAYTLDNLPPFILQDASAGLTTLESDDTPKPGIAKSWIVEQNGKVYKFVLRNDLYFSNGKNVTSSDINYKFSHVQVQKPSPYAIEFRLKDSYSPFLVTLSHPIFKDGYVGIGMYKIKEIKLNGNFVQTISLVSRKNSLQTKTYQFYPTLDALKSAYVLGEVNTIIGAPDINYLNKSFTSFHNTTVSKQTSTTKLTTLFYNTQDSKYLSDSKVRQALTYALPDVFPQGQRSYTPYPPGVWFFANDDNFIKQQDFTHAKLLLDAALTGNKGPIQVTIKTFPEYIDTAQLIKKNWAKINIQTKIEVINAIPGNFQILLYSFNIPKDPDQYALWHSNEPNNITGYRNLRIDKLLEDGRKTSNIYDRKKTYADFENILLMTHLHLFSIFHMNI